MHEEKRVSCLEYFFVLRFILSEQTNRVKTKHSPLLYYVRAWLGRHTKRAGRQMARSSSSTRLHRVIHIEETICDLYVGQRVRNNNWTVIFCLPPKRCSTIDKKKRAAVGKRINKTKKIEEQAKIHLKAEKERERRQERRRRVCVYVGLCGIH